MKKLLIASLLTVGFLGFARAEDAATADEKMGNGPCSADRKAHCAGVEKGEGRIMKCMQENEAKLSAECKTHISEMKDMHKEMRKEMKSKRKEMRKKMHEKKEAAQSEGSK